MSIPSQFETSQSEAFKYRSDIDGLRAVAVLCVMGYHGFPHSIPGGFIGVDIFFVISGFLISSILFKNLNIGTFSVKDFYIRRVRRIFPATIVVLMTCIVFGWIALFADEYQQLGGHVAGGAAFISNLIFWSESGYFDITAEKKPLLHLWSLGIEEQFYIVWPVLLLLLKRSSRNIFLILAVLILASFALNIRAVKIDSVAAFYSPIPRAWELLIGAMLAHLKYQQISFFSNESFRNLKSNAGMAFLFMSVLFIDKKSTFPGWWVLLPVLGTFFIISAGRQAWVNRVILSNKVLVNIGLISFPLYLWHWPVLAYLGIVYAESLTNWMRFAGLLFSALLAWCTFHFIEKPIRLTGKWRIGPITLALLMMSVGVLGLVVYQFSGFPLRLHQDISVTRQFEWNSLYNSSAECKKKYISDDYCNILDIETLPDAVVIGDSHANHFYWGLQEYYKGKGKNVLNLGAGGCPPFIGIDMVGPSTSPNCLRRTKPMYDYILKSENVQTVYIGFWHDAYFAQNLIFTDAYNEIHGLSNYEIILDALVRTVDILSRNGKHVVLLYDMPDLKTNIKDCFIKRPLDMGPACTLDKSMFVQDFERYQSLVHELKARTSVQIFDTHQFIDGNFPVDKDGLPMYRDYSHLSIAGSLFFKDKYLY